MEPRISIITLGVSDLPRAVEFYRDGLGLPLLDENTESIAFFKNRGTWLSLYPRESLAADVGIATGGRWVLRRHSGPQRPHQGGSGRPAGRCGERGSHPGQAGSRHLLGWLLRLLCRPGGLPLGGLESSLLD